MVVVVVGGLSYFDGSAEAFSQAHGGCEGRPDGERERGLQFVACGLRTKLFRGRWLSGGGVWSLVCVERFQRGRRSFRKGKVAGNDGAHGSRRGTAGFCVKAKEQQLRSAAEGRTTTMMQRRDSFAISLPNLGPIPRPSRRRQGFHCIAAELEGTRQAQAHLLAIHPEAL